MRRPVLFAALAFILPALGPAAAQDSQGDALGTLNPDEMTWQRVLENSEGGATDMVTCASGYMLTKSGNHAAARALFRRCAEAGYTGAMTWMSQLDNNGLGADYNPEAAADWDRQAALAGDPVGQFNHGLNLIRGHGIARDTEAGRAFVDRAAAAGLEIATRFQRSGYDPDEVTPDADNWRYAPSF
ncbi:sel1 repeat family protein [Thalassococcus profundi]|uniref:Sel1 repeat family protein n=1 Tax=Thalassococcus profundi TaxID=2282382 RepID=A0A369TKT6_9RHOB|nr:sel1 repeat family protein [Thalassococcus profundi]RDD65949.1 sel1 repeat family protein [Thalassococcus profundi]